MYLAAILFDIFHSVPDVRLRYAPPWRPVSRYETQTSQLNWLQLDLQPEILFNPFHARMEFWDAIYQNKA